MRTKQVYPTSEIAHLWAHQTQDSARNPGSGNFYFKGKTIYSYRDSYPIATLYKDIVFFRLDSYSNTTSKHINHAWGAVSHKIKISCHEVPVYFSTDSDKFYFIEETNKNNFNQWQSNIERLFNELGNPRNRDIQGRLNKLYQEIRQVKAYAEALEITIPPELQELITLSENPELVERAKEATAKKEAAEAKKLENATKIYEGTFLPLWRESKDEEINDLPENDKVAIVYYGLKSGLTRLRYNVEKSRVETSKGVQIPVEIAKGVYLEIKDCLTGNCDKLQVPVLNYTITSVNKKRLIAGCHQIPSEDIHYIANLLNWN